MEFGLRDEVYVQILDIASKYDYDFYIFGSRARNDYKHNSDIDIAIFGDVLESDRIKIMNDFDIIDMEYILDLVFVKDINKEEFLDSIKKDGVILKWKDIMKEEKI